MARGKKNVSEVATEEVATSVEEKPVEKVVNTEPLQKTDEIEIEALIPNVSYKDSKTGDFYEWDAVGHIEVLTVETLENMWRNHKGYFCDLLLKPLDERVVKKFNLFKHYEKYGKLTDVESYANESVARSSCDLILTGTPELRRSCVSKIKNLVASGEISNIRVIKTIESKLHIDLISIL